MNGTYSICTSGSSFVLIGDVLYDNGEEVTSNPSSSYGELAPGNGTVSGGFAIDNAGVLSWSSPSFTNGEASFCLDPDGKIEAVYVQGTQPANCVPVILSESSSSNCPGFNPIYPGPAGPQGSQGIAGELYV